MYYSIIISSDQAYIEATKAFYRVKAPQYLEANGVQNYMKYAELKLREEEQRGEKYLESFSGSLQNVRYGSSRVLLTSVWLVI